LEHLWNVALAGASNELACFSQTWFNQRHAVIFFGLERGAAGRVLARISENLEAILTFDTISFLHVMEFLSFFFL
jgi:hypothetical protein